MYVLSSRDIVFRPDTGHKLDHYQYEICIKPRSNLTITAICPAVLIPAFQQRNAAERISV